MRFTVIERYVQSSDGIHNIHGKLYIPLGTPRATVQIVHGLSEYAGHYDEFMSFLAQRGFVVFAHDHLGHGQTADGADELGFIAEKNGDKYLVADAYNFAHELLENYKGLKHILFGHSMGSFVSRICSEIFPNMADLLILEGTGGPQPLAPLGLALSELGGMLRGPEYRSNIPQKLFVGRCNHCFRFEKSDYSWISRNAEYVKEVGEDDYRNFTFSVSGMHDLVMLSTECNSDEWFDNFRKDLPTLIISGEKDPVGDNGKGVYEVFKKLEDRGVEDLSFKLYRDCRHELLNELNKDEVMNDILCWIENRI